MNMDENKTPIKKRLSEQLPVHSADPESWQRLSAKLDALDATAAYQEKMQQLPVHSPDQGTWAVISSRLNRIAYIKTATRIALSAAAGLLLFFTVSRISDYYRFTPATKQVSQNEQSNNLPSRTDLSERTTSSKAEIYRQKISSPATNSLKKVDYSTSTQKTDVAQNETAVEPLVAENDIPIEMSVPVENTPDQLAQNTSTPDNSVPAKEEIISAPEPKITSVLNVPEASTTSPTLKYYTPEEAKPGNKVNHFAMSMDYLPENIYNGTDNSLFHNVDLTASYNKEKVRFNTSVGMAYNEEQLEFDMNYDVKSPVTATGSDGQLDTLGYNVSTVDAEYQGTEKHQYFTYNLGIGRRLFKIGKFSTWFNAGAGFGVKLNNPDLITSTQNSVKNQYNALIRSVNTPSQPVYNDLSVSFVTGIDFSYKIFNRLSISFSPTSRWYFKPVLTMDNQPTDELTLGFKTGMKFDF
jgi:hypothetical protein